MFYIIRDLRVPAGAVSRGALLRLDQLDSTHVVVNATFIPGRLNRRQARAFRIAEGCGAMQRRFIRRTQMRTWRRNLLVQGVSVLFVCALHLTAAAELRFYASFDETFQADLARGSAAGLVVRRGASLAPDGKWGRAVRGQGTSQLACDCHPDRCRRTERRHLPPGRPAAFAHHPG